MATEPAVKTPFALRDRMTLVLDTDDLVAALRLADELSDWFAVAKVGLELFSAEGPEAVTALVERGWEVFVDLKLFDIPTTVERAARVLGGLGARYVNLHAVGGVPMLRAGVEGLKTGAQNAGHREPIALAVTVLTSEPDAAAALAPRVRLAIEAGCGGVVCGGHDVPTVKALSPSLITVIPGIRAPGGEHHDQARPSTPADALANGADLLLIGRAVTAASDPAAAAEQLFAGLPEQFPPRGS